MTRRVFSKKKNAVRYLHRLDTKIRSCNSKKLTTICLFLDFEKAFDSVWLKGLMYKLNLAGVCGNFWHLINSFLFSRKVRLMFNDYTGLIRATLEHGLPQGACLSPTLFKFYVLDLAKGCGKLKNVDIFKFADDGTILITGRSTKECMETLKVVCDCLNSWCNRWRMVLNCDPGKTELICFNTAENDPSLVPSSILIGNNLVYFVESTKVLGLIIDSQLSYVEHGRYIYKKIVHRWVKICKYTNRNWGFRQHVIVRLVEVLISTCVQYAGFIWLNKKSAQEIEPLWYKMLKAAVGAVFNVKQSVTEVILGIAPIQTTAAINRVKHLLKLNIANHPADPLRALICDEIVDSKYSQSAKNIKDVWQFLKWKGYNFPADFTTNDTSIISNHDLKNFVNLSISCCQYTKQQMKTFTEMLWQKRLNNQFHLEGFAASPKPNLTKLAIPTSSRCTETLFMSLFYENNLFNSFVNSHIDSKFGPACCQCHRDTKQDAMHILTKCLLICSSKRNDMVELLQSLDFPNMENCYLLLNCSRNAKFVELATSIMEEGSWFLRKEIQLG